MKPLFIALLLGTTALAPSVMAETHGHGAAEIQVGKLTVAGAFMRATLPRAPVGGGYVTITNHGTSDDRLVSVSAPIGEHTDIHEMAHENDVMTMRSLPDGLPIPAGETVSLQPSGNHLMFTGLTTRLEEGQTYELTLHFEKAGAVTVPFHVLALNARSHPDTPQTSTHTHGTNEGHDHSAMDHAAHKNGEESFDQTSIEGDHARIEGLLKNMFESPDAPLSVSPILIDGDIAVIGWMQDDAGGRALLSRNDHGLWEINICAGDGLKGEEKMIALGINSMAAKRLAAAQARAEAGLPSAHSAKFSLFDGLLHIENDGAHNAQRH